MARSFSKEEWLELPVGRDHRHRNDNVEKPAVVWSVMNTNTGYSTIEWFDVEWNTPINFSSPSNDLDLPTPSYWG
jgi:hypothetical protein